MPLHSTHTTPISSAYASTYASDDELDSQDCARHMVPITSLTMHDFNRGKEEATAGKKGASPFPFMSLPSELRIKIYKHYFAGVGDNNGIVDLDPDNHRVARKRLAILRTCHTIYTEAFDVFWGSNIFRIFPTHGRYTKTKKALLARLQPHQRSRMSTLELRLGPGWNKPARSWVVNSGLGLRDCVNLRTLNVFVQFDPNNDCFRNFRKADGFYETFSSALLDGILDALPTLERISFDAYPNVKKSGALMRGLLNVCVGRGIRITWGPKRGWTDDDEGKPEFDMSEKVREPFTEMSAPVACIGTLPQSNVLMVA